MYGSHFSLKSGPGLLTEPPLLVVASVGLLRARREYSTVGSIAALSIAVVSKDETTSGDIDIEVRGLGIRIRDLLGD